VQNARADNTQICGHPDGVRQVKRYFLRSAIACSTLCTTSEGIVEAFSKCDEDGTFAQALFAQFLQECKAIVYWHHDIEEDGIRNKPAF
jgi:hypothetical protein